MGAEIGELVVRRSIFISAPPERVWQEFESFERAKLWLSPVTERLQETLVRYEPGVGGWVELKGIHRGNDLHFGGRIIVFDPPHELTFEFDWVPSRGWAAPTLLTVRLTPARAGAGTIVEILHYGFERIGDEAIDAFHEFEGGWDLSELEALRQIVEA